jgi:hypothetical protein
VDKKEFDDKIIGDNTLELYYNKVSSDTKLYTKIVTFTENDFSGAIDTSKLEEVDIPEPEQGSESGNYAKSVWFGYENSSWSNRPLNIAEIEIYSGGVNVATKAIKTESSSQYSSNSYKPKNLIDGNKTNFAHTLNNKTNWFKITLDKKYPIEKVKVYNRTDCCHDRWADSFVKLLDDNGNEITRSTDSISTNKTTAKDYKEEDVRVKTFNFKIYTYEFIMNKPTSSLGIHVEYIKLDGVLATKAQTTIHKSPNRNNKPDNMFSIGSGTENYASWNSDGYSVGDKIFTIKSNKKVDKIDIVYTRPKYAPGWIIKENGVTKITETSNRGGNMNPRPVVYTYDIKNGYLSREDTVLWSSKNVDIDSGYDNKGNGGTDAGTDWNRSKLNATVEDCKKKCNSFSNCKGFSFLTGGNWCYLKSSNDLNKTDTNSSYDFYYKGS